MGGELLFGDAAKLIRNTVQPRDIDEVPYIGLEHIEEGTLRLNGYGSSKNVDSAKFLFREGDILFGKLRPYFRKVIRAPFDGVCSTDIWVVRAKNGVDQGYLYYWMAAEDFVEFATSGSEGTRMPRAKWEHVSRFSRPMLDISEQRAITHILDTLDEKIELNRQMNRTLEAMAQALFKSWFIDFDPVVVNALRAGNPVPEKFAQRAAHYRDNPNALHLPEDTLRQFPDRFQDSELGPIPEGWEVGCLENITGFLNGYAFKSKDWTTQGVPVVKIGSVKPGIVDLGSVSYVSEEIAKKADRFRLAPGDLLIGMTGYVGVVGLVPPTPNLPLLNQRVGKFVLEESGTSGLAFIYCLTRRPEFKLAVEAKSHGTAQANVSAKGILSIQVTIPPKALRKRFNGLIKPFMDQLLGNCAESTELSSLRDTLLPKLISGELRVPDAEKLVEDVA